MLKHFGSGPDNDALLGDLAEQYLQKDSAMWYWRQAMKAIPVSLFKEIRGHKRIAARALLTGWAMWILFVTWIFPLVSPFFFGVSFGVDLMHPRQPIQVAWSVLWAPVLGQASLARPFSYVFAVALPLLAWAVCGWLVARFHREQQTSVVLLFAGSILLTALLLFGPFILTVEPRAAYLFVGPLAANVAASVLGIVLGGGLLRDRSTVSN